MNALNDHRPLIWGLAYRITGSAQDADEISQEALVRAIEHQPAEPRPWLYKVAANLARDQLRRRRRTPYRGPWLPEPIADVETAIARHEVASMALLIAMERLPPTQRAVLVLRDVMELDTAETAAMLGMTEANVRVSHHRARRTLGQVPAPQPGETGALLTALLTAIAAGDVEQICSLLAEDSVSLADADGRVSAQGVPVRGPQRIARLLLGLATPLPGDRFVFISVNGLPALQAERPGASGRAPRQWVFQVLPAPDGRIGQLLSFLHPDKLGHIPTLAPASDEAAPPEASRSRP